MATKQRLPQTMVSMSNAAYGMGRTADALNPRNGNISGFTPDYENFITFTPYLHRHTVPVLVEAPRGFLDVAGGSELVAILKALVETGYRSFEGLNQTLESQFVGQDMGDGNVFEVISDMKITPSAPSYAYTEREQRPIGTFFDWWRTTYGMDPVSKIPNIITEGVTPPDMLPDYYTMTMLFFEPTKTWNKVDKAWLCFNMFPKNSADITGFRDRNRAGELVEFNVEFTCMQQISKGVNEFAQLILETYSVFGASSFKKRSAWQAIDANVKAQNTGFNDQLKQQTQNAVA